MSRVRWFGMLIASSFLAACVNYGGIAKTADGKIYLTGSTSFIVFSSSFVKRCTEEGTVLTCENLTVSDTPGAAAEKDKDAGDDEPKTKPKKKKKPEADDE